MQRGAQGLGIGGRADPVFQARERGQILGLKMRLDDAPAPRPPSLSAAAGFLLPESPTCAQPALRPTCATPNLRLRLGSHPKFSRILCENAL